MSDLKMVCQDCGWQGLASERPIVLNPFEPGTELCGCPGCRDVTCFAIACDEPDCWETVTCGTPTPDGYRSTCSEHEPEALP